MKQKIGHFEFDLSDSISKISYNRTFKDWFDILSSMILAFLCLLVVVFLFLELLKEFDWIYTCIIGIFGFITFLKTSYTVGRLLEPTNELIKIEKEKDLINIRLTKFKNIELKISELSLIIYHLNKDRVEYSDSDSATIIKNRFWIEVEVLTENKELIKILNINPSHFFQKKDTETTEELLNRSKILIKILSTELGIQSKYKKFKNQKN